MNIAITRMASCTALGASLDATVDALRAGRVGISSPSDLEQTPAFESGAGEAPLPSRARGTWRAERALRSTIDELLGPAEHESIRNGRERWAAVIGTTLAGMRHCGVGMRADERADLLRADESFARTSASSVLAHALDGIGFSGPTVSVSCACASALTALSHGCTLLQTGVADAIIVGGYDPISEFAYAGFSALQLVARGPLSPFAPEREGMKLGEGVALLVLRRLDQRLLDHAAGTVHAVVVGRGESSDAHHLTQPHPNGRGAARAIAEAMRGTSRPELIVAHATGTPANDAAEYAAYREQFGDGLRGIPVVALKSRLGHPLGAAGALEACAVLRAAERSVVPTTAGRGRNADEFPDLQLLEGDSQAGSPNEVLVLAAGFGGTNTAVRLSRAAHHQAAPPPHAAPSFGLSIRAVGAVTPAGRGPDLLRSMSEAMRSGVESPLFDEGTLAPLLDRGRSRRLSLLARLMIGAVRDLVESAGIDEAELRETPLIAANWCGAADYTEKYYRDLVRAGIDLANPMLFAESVPNIGSAQCSLAFGIEAPTLSVVGRRTAAVEALWLAEARLRAQEWPRAIVVAAEEAHPIVERVLSRCARAPIQLRSGAIALLVERESPGEPAARTHWGSVRDIEGHTAALDAAAAASAGTRASANAASMVTSGSPFDAPFRGFDGHDSTCAVPLPEMGATTTLAVLLAHARDTHPSARILSLDPHGACWNMTHRAC